MVESKHQEIRQMAEQWFGAAGVAIEDGYQWVPAHRLATAYHPSVEIELPLIVTGFTADLSWSRLCGTLANAYPGQHSVHLLHWHGDNEPLVETMTIQALKKVQHPLSAAAPSAMALCIPPLPAGSSFSALQAIIAHLRSPEGCPWDREQTLLSMRHDLLSECMEVIEAIDRESDGTDNGAHIAEEIGDLLMAGVLMLQIATDAGRFQLVDAMQSIVTKLIRRHPHVFGETAVDGVDAVLVNWDQIKAQEKLDKGQPLGHPLDGIPVTLPALEKARELQSKAQKAGLLDRATVATAIEAQFTANLANLNRGTIHEHDLGELLWTLVAVAQRTGINAEDALRGYSVRFRAELEGVGSRE